MKKEKIDYGVFAHCTVDTTFKLLFASRKNKELTINLINYLLPHLNVTKVTFIDKEFPGESKDERTSVVDVLCESDDGNFTLIEMQNADQPFFLQRMRFYSSKITSVLDGEKGSKFNFDIGNTYIIAFMNYDTHGVWPYKQLDNEVVVHLQTVEEKRSLKIPEFPEYFFIQMHNFDKSENELTDFFEKLLYSLSNAFTHTEIPQRMQDEEMFLNMYETLRVANFSRKTKVDYDLDMKNSKLVDECIEYSRIKGHRAGLAEGHIEGHIEGHAEGLAEGRKESSLEIARNLKVKGLDASMIAECTGLSPDEVEAL